jgi:hypothetical protein
MIRWYLGSYGAHPNGTLSYGWWVVTKYDSKMFN